MDFHQKEVVWAKVKGYPWWPAYINKLPEDTDGNFKVIFFAEDTYALLQPKCVQKFAQNYVQYSKTKAKKFLKALQLANNSANRTTSIPINSKISGSSRKKTQKREQQQLNDQPESEQSQHKSSVKAESESGLNNQQIQAHFQKEKYEFDRKKVEKIQGQLSQIIANLQSKFVKEWKYSKYFETFLLTNEMNPQQLLHSNVTRKIRFIIESMKQSKIEPKQIEKLEQLSSTFKKQVMNYLTDTTYYDQHLKVIDKSRHNKAQIETTITKIMRKRYNGQIKRQFINILAAQIGIEVGKNPKFRSRQLTSQMKEGLFDNMIKTINSKAATQRIADQLIQTYRQ